MTPVQRRWLLSGAAAFAAPALSSVEGAAAGSGAAESASVLHGLYWLTANLAAARPLVIAIDDAHWADSASLAFLSYLARRVEGLALFVVYATRVGEGASEALPAFADAGFSGMVLRPDVLGEQATIELIERSLASASCRAVRARLSRRDGRQPVSPAGAAARAARRRDRAGRGRAVRASRRSRRNDQPGDPRPPAAARRRPRPSSPSPSPCLAAAPSCVTPRPWRGLDADAAGRAADALTRASIVHDRRPLEFIHPIVRTTIYGEIRRRPRAASHKRAAALLAVRRRRRRSWRRISGRRARR